MIEPIDEAPCVPQPVQCAVSLPIYINEVFLEVELETDEFVGCAWVLHRWVLNPATVLRSEPFRIISVVEVLVNVLQLDHADCVVDTTRLELVVDPAGKIRVPLHVHQD